ncbi:MAG: T9SS type A sorting domain-containing protein [Bacteroidota bacterium]
MKKVYTSILLLIAGFCTHAQTYLALQDFSTASNITPPAGWSNISYNDSPNHVWKFATVKPYYLPTDLYGDGVAFPYAVISRSTYDFSLPDTKLSTPSFSTLGSTHATLEFSEFFRWQTGNSYTIDYSVNGGADWALLEARDKDTYQGWQGGGKCTHTTIPLPADAQNKAAVKIRFSYKIVTAAFFWALDNIKVTNRPPATRTAATTGGFWSDASTWVGGIVPAFIDNAVIPDNAFVIIDIHPRVKNLTVGGGTSGYLKFDNSMYNYLEVDQTLETKPGSNFQPNYNSTEGREINVKGNLVLNGNSDFSPPGTILRLIGTGIQNIDGSGGLGGIAAPIRRLHLQSGGGVNINRTLTVTEEATIYCPVNNGTYLHFDNNTGIGIDSVQLTKVNDFNLSSPVLVAPGATYYVRYNQDDYNTVAATTGNEIPASGMIHSLSVANSKGLTVNTNIKLTSAFPLNLYFGVITINPANSITCTNSAYDGAAGYNGAYLQGGEFVLTWAGTATKTFPVGSHGVPATITFNNMQANGTIGVQLLNSGLGSAGTGLTALSATRRWYSRLLTGTYTSYASVTIQLNDNDNFGTTPDAVKRVAFQTSLVSAYNSVGQASLDYTGIRSATVQTLLGYHALGISAGSIPLLFTGSAGTNNWGDAFNWSNNLLPANTDEVIIDGNRTINLASGPGNYFAKNLTIRPGSTINSLLSNSLTVGPPAANNAFLRVYGNFNMTNGTITVKGNAALAMGHRNNSSFLMSGGNLIIDGNNGGNTATSVTAFTPMLQIGNGSFSDPVINGTGGTVTIVDPNAASTSKANAVEIYGSNSPGFMANLAGTSFRFGDGISTDACQAQGFVFQTSDGSVNLPLGQVIVDTRTDANGNRFVSSADLMYRASDISGNLTVNTNGEIRTFFHPSNPYGDIPVTPLVVGGNIINNGVIRILNSDSGRLVLGRNTIYENPEITAPQTISGSGSWTTSLYSINNSLSSLTINNKGGVTLNMPLTVVQNLALLKGVLHTSATNLVTHGEYFYHTPGTLTIDSGYVSGPIKRLIPAAAFSDSTGLFPVGGGGFYRPAKINFTVAPAGGGSITAQFITTNPGKTGLPLNDNGVFIDSITKSGYWEITTSDVSGGTYNVELTGNGFGGITNPAQLRVVKRSNAAAPWTLQGTHAPGSGFTAKRNGLTGFSQFTIASNGAQNSLPVTLLYIRGQKQGTVNTIYWATATEINNHGFELERSADGIHFSTVVFIASRASNGNSQSVLNYQFSDDKGFSGRSFYRIRQIDKDARVSFSSIVTIKDAAAGFSIDGVYPNPAVQTLHVSIPVTASGKAQIMMTDLSGKTVMQQTVGLQNGDNILNLDVSRLSKGGYIVKVINEKGNSSIKSFVKQ